MAHNNPSDLNRFVRDTTEESSPSSSPQSQRRRLTGSQWTGGDNRALQYLSDVATEGFEHGWGNPGSTLPRETGDTHHPIAGSELQPPDEGENLYSPSGHLGPPLGQAYHTGYDVPSPSSLAQNLGWTQDFSSLTSGADAQAGFTEQQLLGHSSITGPSGGEMNLYDTPLPAPLDEASDTDYRGHVAYGFGDPYRMQNISSLTSEFGDSQSFEPYAARPVGPSFSQTESLYSSGLNPVSDFGSSQGEKRKRSGNEPGHRHPSAFSSQDRPENVLWDTDSVVSGRTTRTIQEGLGSVALHSPQTQKYDLSSEIEPLVHELKKQVASIKDWPGASLEQRKSLLKGLPPEQKKNLLERIAALDPKVTQWVNDCRTRITTLNNTHSLYQGELFELEQQWQQAKRQKEDAESAKDHLATQPMGYYIGFEDQIQEYGEDITRLDTNVENANNQYNNKKQELDPLIESNDAEIKNYNNKVTQWNSFLKYMRMTLKENLQVSPLSAQGDGEGYMQGPSPSDAQPQQAEPQPRRRRRPGRKKREVDVSVDLFKREILPKLEPDEYGEQPILPKLEPDEYGAQKLILPKPDPGGDGPAEQRQEIELSAGERDLVRRRADGWLDVAAQNMVANGRIKELKDVLGLYQFTKEESRQLREKCRNIINGLKLKSRSLKKSAEYDRVYLSLMEAIHRNTEGYTPGLKQESQPVLDKSGDWAKDLAQRIVDEDGKVPNNRITDSEREEIIGHVGIMARDLRKRSVEQVMDAKRFIKRVNQALRRRVEGPSSEVQP